MYTFLQIIIDFLFPPSKEEIRLREISPEQLETIVKEASAPEFPFINSLFSYKDPLVKELVWQIKYKKNRHCLKCAATALHRKLLKYKPEEIILIPIPISKKRRKERGYNQCELIIDEITKIDNKIQKDFNLLVRIKDIEKQTFKNRNERIQNTERIFQVNGRVLDNKKIIIIDDVSTTGSTLKEARKTLIDSGFIDVEALTLAH